MTKKILLTALMAVSFIAGCKDKTSETSASVNPGESGSQQVSGSGAVGPEREEIKDPWWKTTGSIQKDAEGNVQFNGTTLKLTSVVAGEDQSAFEELVATFNASYSGKINVEFTSVNQAEFEKTVSTQIANNMNAPDLIMSHQKGHKSFVQNKLIRPYDEAFEKTGITIDVKRDFVNGLAKYCDLGYKGYTFDVPADMQSVVIYYNKKLLAKYGGNLPTNRTEFLDLCSRFKTGEGSLPVVWDPGEVFFPNYIVMTALAQNGVQFYGEDDYAHWTEPANLQAMKNGFSAVRDIYNLGYSSITMAASTAKDNFINDKALFYFYMPWNATSLAQSFSATHGGLPISTIESDYIGGFSMAGLFAKDEGALESQAIFGDSHFFGLTTTCEDITKQAAALTFLKWFTENGEAGATWAEAGHASASTIITNSNEYVENTFVGNFISAFYPDANSFVTAGNNEFYEEIFVNGLFNIWASVKSNADDSNDEAVITAREKAVNEVIEFLKD